MIPFLFVILIFSFPKVFSSEVYRERYVIRQNIHFELDCKSINKTRVKWEYFSINETIYDSHQPNKIFKSGFEASCQPHNGVISTCILKLVQARKEDSGKYICYVGEENEAMNDSNLLKPVTEIELVVRGPTYQNVVANKGDSVTLPCEHNIRNLTRARWSHYSIHGVLTYAVYHLPAKETINKNYEALCEPHQLSCNLKILQANKESAGRYICMVGESLEFEQKYGLDQMTHFVEIQFVVGELECNENMNKDLTLIGEIDCHGIEADVLNLKCSFNYFGNINYNLLHLRWIEKHKFNSLEKKLNSSLIKHEVKDETNKISIQTNLSVAYEMQNSTFQCVLDDTAVKPCQLNEFRTQYAKNTTRSPQPINSDELQNKICLANKSANVQCSYYWVHETPGAMAENPHALLPVENMRSLGIYTCFAKCEVGNHKECIIRATEFEIIHGSHKFGLIIGLIIGIIIVAVTIGGICFVLRKKRLLFRRKNRKEQIKTVEGEVQQEAKGLLGKHTSQKTDDKVDADGGESSTLSHGKQQDKNKTNDENGVKATDDDKQEQLRKKLNPRANEFLKNIASGQTIADHENERNFTNLSKSRRVYSAMEKGYKLLMVKEVLYEEKSEHHDIKIYESTKNGKVLMLDGAIWVTEFDSINQKALISTLLISHEEPKDVLVIGGGDGAIVKKLLNHQAVESITVYEEIIKLGRECFPSITSSLENPKVKVHIGDGNEFVKKQKNAFDVIIIRSTNVQDDYLDKEYFEVIEKALKKEGVVSFIVDGKDTRDDDVDIMPLAMILSGQIFPVVQYFILPFHEHPGTLTRCLMCSLNPKNDFRCAFEMINEEVGKPNWFRGLRKKQKWS